jgi:hypothetical protein
MFFSSTEFHLLCCHAHMCVWFCFLVIKNIKLFYYSLKKIQYQIDELLNDIQHFNIKIFDVYVRVITNWRGKTKKNSVDRMREYYGVVCQ